MYLRFANHSDHVPHAEKLFDEGTGVVLPPELVDDIWASCCIAKALNRQNDYTEGRW